MLNKITHWVFFPHHVEFQKKKILQLPKRGGNFKGLYFEATKKMYVLLFRARWAGTKIQPKCFWCIVLCDLWHLHHQLVAVCLVELILFKCFVWFFLNYYLLVKAGYTFGNCQRPVPSLGVSQRMHKNNNPVKKFGFEVGTRK